jgi:uncharacterized protein (TIGR02246 family)
MRKRKSLMLVSLGVAALCAGFLAHGQNQSPPDSVKKAAEGAAEKSSDSADEQAIRASAEAFSELYNKHDAKGLAALFALKAEMVDEGGKLVRGRAEIEAEFTQQFRDEPECSTRVDIDSIRVLTPHLALEEGVARSKSAPDQPEQVTSYTCVHVKVDEKWLLASVTDFPAEPEDLTPHEHLKELAWLVGEWLDESPDSTVHSTCDWDDSGNFLMYHFAEQIAGGISMHGTTRIGWDAVRKQFRSWVFDSTGGFTDGLWSRVDDEWIVKANGATAEGETCSSTNVYRIIDDDTYTFRSHDRIIDGELTAVINEIVIKRRVPAPVE